MFWTAGLSTAEGFVAVVTQVLNGSEHVNAYESRTLLRQKEDTACAT